MKAEKIYLLPAKVAKKATGNRLMRSFLAAGILLCGTPSMAQYYNVSHPAGMMTIAGVDVTATPSNSDVSSSCGTVAPYREALGGMPGSYTWSFSAPVNRVRLNVDAIDIGDVVTFEINGAPYAISSNEIRPLGANACLSSTTAIESGGALIANMIVSGATVDIVYPAGINTFTISSLGLGSGVLTQFNFAPVANIDPYFVNGSTQTFPICQDAAAADMTALLVVNDGDNGQQITWSLVSGPSHGAVTGYPSADATNGTDLTSTVPFTYQPTAGYHGADQIIVQANDDNGGIIYDTVNITVHPTPDVVLSGNQVKCNGAATDSAYFLSSVPGATFGWVAQGTSGLAPTTGSGDILSFTATNGSFVPVVDTIIVTPTANSCVGTADTFTITVNPTPNVYGPTTNDTVCNGNATAAATFTSDVDGTTYTWANDNTAIGLLATGSGNIGSFSGANSSTATITGNVTVTPHANGCAGSPMGYSVTVYPTPKLNTTLTPADVCYNSLFHYVPNSATADVTYTWTRDAVTDISNPASAGIDSVDETLVNTGVNPVAVNYAITSTANGCSNTQTVTVMINPELLLNTTLSPAAVCSGDLFSYTANSNTSGVTYQWTRNPVTGIRNAGVLGSTVNPVTEALIDTTAAPVIVTYNYSIIYNACFNTQDVKVTVNPTPRLTSTLTPAAICDNTTFKYMPTFATTGSTFAWSRGTITGISTPAASGVDSVEEALVNTDPNPVTVTYADTIKANGCTNVEYMTVSVNPKPWLSSAHADTVCNKTVFNYVPNSLTLGYSSTWSRLANSSIANAAASDTGVINETLNNTTANPVTVLYIDTLTINGCQNTDTIKLVVNPTPRLSSTRTPTAICDSAVFNYTPTSATVGTTFAWVRPYVAGINLTEGAGTNNPNEQMINNTNDDLLVKYMYTLTANGCSAPDTVTIAVRPTPRLSSDLTVSTCSSAPFTYVPESFTDGTTFTWSRSKVNGILPNTGSGSGNVNETLVDTSYAILFNTKYKFVLSYKGCSDTQYVVVTVNPAPVAPAIAISSSNNLCSNTQYQNFGAATAAAAGTFYNWSAVNASVMATGNNRQNALISFPNSGTAKVIVTSSIATTACRNADTLDVTVGSGDAGKPVNVIYYNGQFISLQNDVDGYQWGFDDALTLDSTLLKGEVNQVYFNNAPDLTYRYYWLMTTKNGCVQKSYFNVPTGITNVNSGEFSSVKVYPNPTSSNLNVEVNSIAGGNVEVEISNLLGQKMNTTQTVDNKATVNVSNLPAGCYLVNCYQNGVKIATSKFIKN